MQEEGITLIKKAKCHENSEKFKKNNEDEKVPGYPRWRPGSSSLGISQVSGERSRYS
jgi:hypothetical protein